MIQNKDVRIACSCGGGHIFPEDSIVIDSASGNHPEDWWIHEECRRCGSRMIIGGEIVAGNQFPRGDYLQSEEIIFPPAYID